MSVVQLLKKASQFFRRSKKEKKKNDLIIGCTPQIDNILSSSQPEGNCDEKDDDDGGGGEGEKDPNNLKNVNKLFIGCLALSTTSKDLEDYFSQFGEVKDCTVLRNPRSRISREFGFVTFVHPQSAKAALDIKNHILDGKMINVRPRQSKPKERNYENRVFLGSLPFDFTEKDVREFFEKFGEVEDVSIPFDRNTMKSKGFGFLSFKNKFVAEKCIAEGFVYMNKRRVLIRKAEPPDFYKTNDNLSIDSTSDINIEKGLEITECFTDDTQFSSLSDGDGDGDGDDSSVVSDESRSVIKLNSEIQKHFEDYFLTKISNISKMSKTKDENNKSDVGEVEKLLEEFFITSSEQFAAFGEDLIEFSDEAELTSSDLEEDTTDEDDEDAKVSAATNFERTSQKFKTEFTNIFEDKTRSCAEILGFKSSAPQMNEFFNCQKSLKPFKIKDEKGSLVCSLCQWMPPESSWESFLAHCKTPAHRIKLKERFLLKQNQEDERETASLQNNKKTQETCPKPETLPEKKIACSQKSLLKQQNTNQTTQKTKSKEQKELQSQQQPQVVLIGKKSKKSKKKKNKDMKQKEGTQKSLKSEDKIIAVKTSALAKSMAYIQPLSEEELICKMCSKVIPKALDTGTSIKNVSHHIQSKGHLRKVLEIEDSLRKTLEKCDKKIMNDDAAKKLKNSSEKNPEGKKIATNPPKVETKNPAPSAKKQTISNPTKVSKTKNPAPETATKNLQKEKTEKKKLCSNPTDLKKSYLCLACDSNFQNYEVFRTHMNSKTHLDCFNNKKTTAVSAPDNLHKCNGCNLWLTGSLYDINKHYAKCLERKN